MNNEQNKINHLKAAPFDKALLSEAEGLRANGINQSFPNLRKQVGWAERSEAQQTTRLVGQ